MPFIRPLPTAQRTASTAQPGDARRVREGGQRGAGGRLQALIGRVAVENGDELLSGDRRVRAEQTAAEAVHDAAGLGPGDGRFIVAAGVHILERISRDHGLALHAAEAGHEHASGDVGLWGELRRGDAVHEAVLIYVAHVVIVPVAGIDVAERQLAVQQIRQGEDAEAAAGEAEGIGALVVRCAQGGTRIGVFSLGCGILGA